MKHTLGCIKTVNEWRNCPMANYVCAAFDASKNEANGPKGKMYFLSLLLNGHMEWDELLVKRFYECCLCNMCSTCGFDDTDIAAAVNAARFDIAEADLMPKPVKETVEAIKQSCVWLKDKKLPDGDTGFIAFGKGHAAALDRIAKAAGINLSIVDEGEYDSALLYELGGSYKEVVEAIDAYLPGKKVVVDSPHLALLLKRKSASPERYIPLPVFLSGVLPGLPLKKLEKTAALQDPCRMARGLDDTESLRKVLAILGITVKEMRHGKKDARCCGGPAVALVNLEMSRRIGQSRQKDVQDSKAPVVAVACAHCLKNFEDNGETPVMDILLAAAAQL